eukprot:gnl/MRDRNA2_/MRDRNA2_220500_c0_seq1.p1 gnl/MRDRNA2_/MRDRNA2_220500_c0~~gnl/MRDRNA2_/MRDRNA2_220500_c0_seq1.p1  ORF type:complete len:257 (+),score=60.04 gnl/MRDRNA2_/MRDRNA2_220500_c0_seq1:70-771(+)
MAGIREDSKLKPSSVAEAKLAVERRRLLAMVWACEQLACDITPEKGGCIENVDHSVDDEVGMKFIYSSASGVRLSSRNSKLQQLESLQKLSAKLKELHDALSGPGAETWRLGRDGFMAKVMQSIDRIMGPGAARQREAGVSLCLCLRRFGGIAEVFAGALAASLGSEVAKFLRDEEKMKIYRGRTSEWSHALEELEASVVVALDAAWEGSDDHWVHAPAHCYPPALPWMTFRI